MYNQLNNVVYLLYMPHYSHYSIVALQTVYVYVYVYTVYYTAQYYTVYSDITTKSGPKSKSINRLQLQLMNMNHTNVLGQRGLSILQITKQQKRNILNWFIICTCLVPNEYSYDISYTHTHKPMSHRQVIKQYYTLSSSAHRYHQNKCIKETILQYQKNSFFFVVVNNHLELREPYTMCSIYTVYYTVTMHSMQ